MKTVIDAVNEFKGEWPCGWGWMCQTSKLNVTYPLGTIRESIYPDVNERHIHLCSKEEFLATVLECGTNFGEWPERYYQYKAKFKYMAAPTKDLDKELDVDIDWSEAPKDMDKFGNIGICEAEVFYNSKRYYYKKSGKEFMFNMKNGVTFDSNEVNLVSTRPKSIFTQEMVDDDVLPGVGMKCLMKNHGDWEEVEIIHAIDGKVCAYSEHHSDYYCASYCKFKPLTPPKTDKEKLIEEFQNALHDAFGTHTADDWSSIEDIASDLFDSFLIQPLTVEVK